MFWIWTNVITFFIYYALQGVSHWMFAYEYYNMVRVISYVMDDIPVPASIVKKNRAQYWFWLILNVVVAFLFAITFYVYFVAKFVNFDL